MTQISDIVKKFRHQYDGYRYFITGSVARNEAFPSDIDVNILPPIDLNVSYSVEELEEWGNILKNFDGLFIDDLRVDAQIIPMLSEVINGYRGEINRYVYREGAIEKRTSVVQNTEKNIIRGIDKIPFAYLEI